MGCAYRRRAVVAVGYCRGVLVTTIAFKAGVLASDSRCCAGHKILSDRTKKLFTLANGAIAGFAGDTDHRQLRDILGKAKPDAMPSKVELAATREDCAALVVFPTGEVFEVLVNHNTDGGRDVWDAYCQPVAERAAAVGSGEDYALTAMKLGRSAPDAVRHAITEDSGSGGRIQTLSLPAAKRRKRSKRLA